MKNIEIVDNLSTLFVEALSIFFNTCGHVEKLSTEIVENPWPLLVYVDIVEKLSTEIVEKIMLAEELWKARKSYPQSLWISP